MDVDLRGAALGFAAAALVLAVLVWFIGVEDLVTAASALDRSALLVIAAPALCWLVAWGQSLRTVLGALDIPVSHTRAVALYASAAFANNVTPFGQAGGEPLSALFISRSTNSEYETGFAAIASVDALNFVPSIVLALVGLAYYALSFTLQDRLVSVIGLITGLAVVVPLGGYVLWRSRSRLVPRFAAALGTALGAVGRVVPRVSPPGREALQRRLRTFVTNIERVGEDRSTLLLALGFSALGWLCMMGSLWATLHALGHGVAPWVVMIAVPVGALAGAAPLPGGLGGVEFALVLLLVPITGVSAAAAATAALVYRGATYWLPTVIGGLSVALFRGHSPKR